MEDGTLKFRTEALYNDYSKLMESISLNTISGNKLSDHIYAGNEKIEQYHTHNAVQIL